ncbi:MAG: ABC transporter substrate-binding protein [Dehalococcoidia bacterium]|nr:ABC transporter substrate-binding protein [Dehalococcoidia bacterium]
MRDDNYWMRRLRAGAVSRRRFVGGAAGAGLGAAALGLVGCGDDDDSGDTDGDATSAPATAPATQGVASATATATEAVKKGGTYRTGTFLNVLGIDPHIEVSVGLTQMARVYTFLGGFSIKDQTFKPLLAETVEIPGTAGTEFIFKLRKDAKWQNTAPVNGRPVTAEDVKYSYERFRDLPQAQNNDFFKAVVDKMEVIDANTFRLTTKFPYAESLSEIGDTQKAIVAKEDVEAKKDLSTGGVGAGPYMIESYAKGESIVLKKNPDYFDKSVAHVDKMQWQTILDMSTLLQAYQSDQHDVCGALLTKLDYEELKKNSNLVNSKMPALHYGSFGMNASVKPFDNPMVRQAIYVGVDRKQFVDKVFQGEATPMGPISVGLDYWALPQSELATYIGPDVKKAKELLSAAGYPDGFEFDIETSGGVQLYIDHAEVLVPELKKLGITANLKLSDLSTYLSAKLFKGDFNATIFTHNPYESPKIPLAMYHNNGLGGGSWWHYKNDTITAAIDKQSMELDVAKRKEQMLEIQRQLLKDGAPMMNFASPQLFSSYHKRVGGFDPTLRTYQVFAYTENIKG